MIISYFHPTNISPNSHVQGTFVRLLLAIPHKMNNFHKQFFLRAKPMFAFALAHYITLYLLGAFWLCLCLSPSPVHYHDSTILLFPMFHFNENVCQFIFFPTVNNNNNVTATAKRRKPLTFYANAEFQKVILFSAKITITN